MPTPIRQTSTHSAQSADLAPAQAQVVSALAQGQTVTAAATAGVHRSTIHNWLKSSPPFSAAIDEARIEYKEQLCDEMKEMTAIALRTLRGLLDDPKASPSVRLKASLAVLNRRDWALPVDIEPAVEQEFMQQLVNMEKGIPNPFPPPDTTPRNAACPCGSGLKFKRCRGVEAPPHLGQKACA
jgi:SEC-C motif